MGPIGPSWQQLAEEKRISVWALIPSEWRIPSPLPSAEDQRVVTGAYVQQFLSADEIDITETDAVRLVEQLRAGKRTAEEVVTAFCHRAALAHQLTNCLHEIFFEAAIAHAKELDAHFSAGNGVTGPLHGLPVSFKDQFHVKGVETTMGYVGWINTFEGEQGTGLEKKVESELVRTIRNLGAIPFCKTSLPHTVMSMETWTNIFGYTLNPNNRLMSTGGSSGGEGALIAMRGSPIGFGTDIGGSIRIPSAFNGLYGIRPSFGRLPYLGAANSMPGQNTIPSVCGPLAPTAGALKLMLKSILSQKPWLQDPAVVELPWRESPGDVSNGAQLAFGIRRNDGLINPQPPVQRALEMVKNLIVKMGHEIIEWDPPASHVKGVELALEIFTSDGGLDIHHHIGLSGEPLQKRIAQIYGEKPSAPKTSDVVWDNNIKHRKFQKEYMDYWNSTAKLTKSGRPVDAILAPVAPFAALQFGKSAHASYTAWVNVLDYTAVAFPVTKVDKNIDTFNSGYQPLSETDRVIWEEYDPQIQHGTPVGLQLVGRRFQEEKMLGLAEMFEKMLGER